MKDIFAKSRFAALALDAATGAAGSDLILNEIDTGVSGNGTLVLVINNAAASDIANLEVWTSNRSDFLTSGAQEAAVTSDGTALVAITSDPSSCYAQGVLGASISAITISSNKITAIYEDGMYVLACRNIGRYLNVSYDSDGTGGVVSAVLIGHDVEEAPWAGARTAY